MIDQLDFLNPNVKAKFFNKRIALVEEFLSHFPIPPVEWRFDDPDPDGAVGFTDCPHADMHSGHDDRPHLFRIWIDRKCPRTGQSKVFFSCRHESCAAEVWNTCLQYRLFEENPKLHPQQISTVQGLRAAHPETILKLNMDAAKEIEQAKKGRELYNSIIAKAPTDDAIVPSLKLLKDLSPFPVSKLSFHEQTLLHLSAFPPGQYIWNGDVRDSSNPKCVRPTSQFETTAIRLKEFSESDLQEEDPVSWPSLKPFITGAIFHNPTLARCSDNVLMRLYNVLEADSNPLDFSKPMPMKYQVALAVYLIQHTTDQILAVVHSGGKSLHIWCSKIIHPTRAHFFTGCFPSKCGILPPKNAPKKWKYGGMGFDPAPLNVDCQPVRLAGIYRHDKEKHQSLLYFNPKAIHTPTSGTTSTSFTRTSNLQ